MVDPTSTTWSVQRIYPRVRRGDLPAVNQVYQGYLLGKVYTRSPWPRRFRTDISRSPGHALPGWDYPQRDRPFPGRTGPYRRQKRREQVRWDLVFGLGQGDSAHDGEVRARPVANTFSAYHGLGTEGFTRKTVRHSVGQFVRDMAHTNGIKSFWALLKRGYYGIYHFMSAKHLQEESGRLPFAKWRGKIDLGGNELDCYVLDDGKCVLSSSSTTKAIANIERGSLRDYIGQKTLNPFIDKDKIL